MNSEELDQALVNFEDYDLKVKDIANSWNYISSYENVTSHYYEYTPEWNDLNERIQYHVIDLVTMYIEDLLNEIQITELVHQAMNEIKEQAQEEEKES